MTGSTPDFAWLFVKMIAGLVLVLCLAFVLIRYILPRSRFGRVSGGDWVSVVARFPLEPRKHLWLVKIAERYLLVGAGEGSLSLLAELTRAEGEKIEAQIK